MANDTDTGLDSPEIEAEQTRWQQAIYELLKDSVDDGHLIDGSGCDSGDPLDLTLAEITQAINMLKDQHGDAISDLIARM